MYESQIYTVYSLQSGHLNVLSQDAHRCDKCVKYQYGSTIVVYYE